MRGAYVVANISPKRRNAKSVVNQGKMFQTRRITVFVEKHILLFCEEIKLAVHEQHDQHVQLPLPSSAFLYCFPEGHKIQVPRVFIVPVVLP
jgi:hypothetical protein